ncbi:zonadhesin-like [Styela clava]
MLRLVVVLMCICGFIVQGGSSTKLKRSLDDNFSRQKRFINFGSVLQGSKNFIGNLMTNCPSGMEYTSCASSCPASCDDLSPICEDRCEKDVSCACKEGTVFQSKENNTCVEIASCPERGFFEQLGKMISREVSWHKRFFQRLFHICLGPKVFMSCGPTCRPTCENPFPICDFEQVTDENDSFDCDKDIFCVCPEGYIEQSHENSTCVEKKPCEDRFA